MNTNKLLSSLNYFSVFFAGFILPIIVYFVSEDKKVKTHAKRALFSHLTVFIPMPFVIYGIFEGAATDTLSPFFIVSISVLFIINFVVVIWNLVNGIKIIAKEEF